MFISAFQCSRRITFRGNPATRAASIVIAPDYPSSVKLSYHDEMPLSNTFFAIGGSKSLGDIIQVPARLSGRL